MGEQTQPKVTVEAASLTIHDLAELEAAMRVASSRGAFQASEFSRVGQVYDKLRAFLQSVQDQQAKEKEEATNAATQAPAVAPAETPSA